MQARIDFSRSHPAANKAMLDLQRHVNASGIEAPLMELVKTRASQINACAFCIDMHTRDARAHGESEERLHLLAAWREAPHYTERERAALAWTEALTLVSETHVPDEVYEHARSQFAEDELVALSMAIVAINGWNRLCVAFRTPPARR